MHDKIVKQYPWLSNEFFGTILRKELAKPKLLVTVMYLENALQPGENYGSQIIRAHLRYIHDAVTEKEETLSLIVKAKLVNADGPRVFADLDVFEREITVYQQILPKVEALYRSIGQPTKFAPRQEHY